MNKRNTDTHIKEIWSQEQLQMVNSAENAKKLRETSCQKKIIDLT